MNPSPLRIAFLTKNLGLGGSQKQLVGLALRLKARGWDVSIVGMMADDNLYETELAAAQIPVHCLHMKNGWRSVVDVGTYRRAAALLRKLEPHILHSFAVHANITARITRLLKWVPVQISSARNTIEGASWRYLVYRLTDPLCDITTQNSRAGFARYARIKAVPADRMRYIPNGVNVQAFRPDPVARVRLRQALGIDDQFVWLVVSRLAVAKDPPGMIQAFARLAIDHPSAVLLLAGEGEKRSDLEKIVDRAELGERVRFLGLRRDIPDLMNAADAYLMTSIWEGTPNVLLEAAATGLPIVATDVGDNRAVVVDQESAFIVKPRDYSALAAQMDAVMRLTEAERQHMGRIGRDYVVAHYRFEQIIEQWEALYFELLDRKGIAHPAKPGSA